MKDQAASLRRMAFAERSVAAAGDGPPTLVVASGKGGVGKSVVATVLAAGWAERHRRVLLVEGDQNLGSLHIVLGVRPAGRLEAVARQEASPTDLLTPVTDHLWLLPGDTGAEGLYSLGAVDRARLHHRLFGVFDQFDAVVVDAGSDLEAVVRVASMGGTHLIVVTAPEPAALIGAYAMMKTVHLRVPGLPMDVLVNRADRTEGRRAFDRIDAAAERFLKRRPGYLGAIPEDAAVKKAVREPGRLIKNLKNSHAVRELRTIAATRLDHVHTPEVARSAV